MQTPEPDSLWFLDGHVTILLAQRANADGLSIMEHWMPHGFGPPLHVHRTEDESFYIVEGRLRFKAGEAVREAGPGELVYLPQGVPHGFRVISEDGARCVITTRGQFETMVRRCSRPAESVRLPEKMAVTPEMAAEFAAICADLGIDFVGPPIE